ncbi:WecB/TagA/CpsF family glycosyltransferase [Deinococcus humi]|uniref:N-acetylglucosaminyldiphosphoundecaprenol N-acetyl-beta-D-mannosaminyltransferase n=1 Tax=Deinococcus humi TaxID=662880 RepID=A0A7W8NG46_9DEIO|nr:WecB/TagA/CpsF family glycosyltransferase [Deinococcus humi]MBB5365086.1 N-acetylglucosaminyldiphosphoundecaprenol N-acetyl-beta-D-mannosaminyltransferase [Deinococcus humi]GGO39544.1 UDP-N-acetyl-D-mannosaminuronic acid transferase [Deinococcus humi]
MSSPASPDLRPGASVVPAVFPGDTNPRPPLISRAILGMRVDVTTYADATARIIDWARSAQARYVCASNVHMVMETNDSAEFRDVVNGADLVTSDGVPLVWALKALGVPQAERVYGPTLMLHVCEAAARARLPIALYGGTSESLEEFVLFLQTNYPGIEIACLIAPPFRPLTPEEDAMYTQQIVDSGARIVFVGIGCPKQERWMAAHTDRLDAVLLGMGAAFDFHSGRVRQAPAVMQRLGLEWLFRLIMEPRRLWKRYAKHNPRFVGKFLLQLLGQKIIDRGRTASRS